MKVKSITWKLFYSTNDGKNQIFLKIQVYRAICANNRASRLAANKQINLLIEIRTQFINNSSCLPPTFLFFRIYPSLLLRKSRSYGSRGGQFSFTCLHTAATSQPPPGSLQHLVGSHFSIFFVYFQLLRSYSVFFSVSDIYAHVYKKRFET